jgi:hypothetical protein
VPRDKSKLPPSVIVRPLRTSRGVETVCSGAGLVFAFHRFGGAAN